LLTEITRAAAAENLLTLRIIGRELDHGTAVPLYFLQRNGWSGRVVALGYSFLSNDRSTFASVNASVQLSTSWAGPLRLSPAGDLSHRLKPEATGGLHPQAHLFDEEVVDAIRSCATRRIVDLDPELRHMAANVVIDRCWWRLAPGKVSISPANFSVTKAPFGVGYL